MPSRDSMQSDYPAPEAFDLSRIPDGTFLGEYRIDDIGYQVQVTVETRQITGITIISGMQQVFVKRCALCKISEMVHSIVERQGLAVDAVSGATQTSNAIVNAIRDALTPPYVRIDG